MPQWNCSCPNCTAARAGKIVRRTQSSIALSATGESWLLINASPDLRAQIESFPALQPKEIRRSPLRDVLLTNADLDHVLGLFLLREHNQTLRIHCTSSVRVTLQKELRFDTLLQPYCGIEWHDLDHSGSDQMELADLGAKVIYLRGQLPRYARRGKMIGQSIAVELFAPQTGRRLLIAPDVASINSELQSALNNADAVIFDGTFWNDDELQQIDPRSRRATQMGHLPIASGSLTSISHAPARHRIYTHINNTNPVLRPGTPERSLVEAAGIVLGEDGMELEL